MQAEEAPNTTTQQHTLPLPFPRTHHHDGCKQLLALGGGPDLQIATLHPSHYCNLGPSWSCASLARVRHPLTSPWIRFLDDNSSSCQRLTINPTALAPGTAKSKHHTYIHTHRQPHTQPARHTQRTPDSLDTLTVPTAQRAPLCSFAVSPALDRRHHGTTVRDPVQAHPSFSASPQADSDIE
jgi:hypothetical protein